MSSVAAGAGLRKRRALDAKEVYSLEAAVSYAAEAAEDQLEDLVDISRTANDNIEEINRHSNLISGLDTLIENTLTDYSTSKFSVESQMLFAASLESILLAAGIGVDVDRMYPSMELAIPMTGSVAAKPAEGILARVLVWLAELIEKLRSGIVLFVSRLRNNKTSLKKYVDEVTLKLNKMTKDVASDDQVSVKGIGDFLMDRHDKFGKPDQLIVSNVALYSDFLNDWRKIWDPLINIQVPSSLTGDETALAFKYGVDDRSVRLSENKYDHDLRFIITHHLEVNPGNGSNPVLSASTKIAQSAHSRGDTAVTLTKPEMRNGIDAAVSALKLLDELDRDINKTTGQINKIAQATKALKVQSGKNAEASVRDALKVIAKACTLSTWGYMNTAPLLLKSIKASIRYIDLSSSHYL